MPERPVVEPVRRLVLVRHAKADSAGRGGPDDHDRELTERGRRQSAALGPLLAQAGIAAPELVLVSSAVRAVQTWQGVAAALAAREVRVEPDLYRAPAQELVHLLAATGDQVRSLVVVGHEPVVSETAVALAGPGSDGAALAAVRAGARTGSATVLELPDGWASLTAGSCALVVYLVP